MPCGSLIVSRVTAAARPSFKTLAVLSAEAVVSQNLNAALSEEVPVCEVEEVAKTAVEMPEGNAENPIEISDSLEGAAPQTEEEKAQAEMQHAQLMKLIQEWFQTSMFNGDDVILAAQIEACHVALLELENKNKADAGVSTEVDEETRAQAEEVAAEVSKGKDANQETVRTNLDKMVSSFLGRLTSSQEQLSSSSSEELQRMFFLEQVQKHQAQTLASVIVSQRGQMASKLGTLPPASRNLLGASLQSVKALSQEMEMQEAQMRAKQAQNKQLDGSEEEGAMPEFDDSDDNDDDDGALDFNDDEEGADTVEEVATNETA